MSKIRGPKKTEVLRIRNAKGRFTKFKSDRKLFFYYYDKTKPKGKQYRPIYKDKKGNPSPRRLTSTQLRFITAKRTSVRGSTVMSSIKFKITSDRMIIDQVADHGDQIMRMIRAQLKDANIAFVYAVTRFKDGAVFISNTLAIGKDWSKDAVVKAIAVSLIIEPLQAGSIRMSPKKNSKKQAKKHKRQAEVQINVAKY